MFYLFYVFYSLLNDYLKLDYKDNDEDNNNNKTTTTKTTGLEMHLCLKPQECTFLSLINNYLQLLVDYEDKTRTTRTTTKTYLGFDDHDHDHHNHHHCTQRRFWSAALHNHSDFYPSSSCLNLKLSISTLAQPTRKHLAQSLSLSFYLHFF